MCLRPELRPRGEISFFSRQLYVCNVYNVFNELCGFLVFTSELVINVTNVKNVRNVAEG
jgi:hypothetical protein